MPNKTALRASYRATRDALSLTVIEAASDHVRDHVLAMPAVRSADSVFVYCSVGSEVQTYNLIEDLLALGKAVAVPRVTDMVNGVMDAVPIQSLKDLVPGPFGVLAPLRGAAVKRSPDIALVPGLAFSPVTGHRLGYGRGFFDRFLAIHPDTMPVGLAFEEQLIDVLPADKHDRIMTCLVTPRLGVRRTPSNPTTA